MFYPRNYLSFLIVILLSITTALGQNTNQSKFKQLGQDLPTPNVYRNAAGAPGHDYWQQKADYDMKIRLDDETQRIYGDEMITYHNQSPDRLTYLWLQLDQNVRAQNSDKSKTQTNSFSDKRWTYTEMTRLLSDFDGGFKIDFVKDKDGNKLPFVINSTMMRVDLPQALEPGESFSFSVKWWYNIQDRLKLTGRSGWEYFEEDGNYLYTIAQFFPRMCVYSEVEGWQNKQFLGRGEFTLPFGDYKFSLTVPADHVVAATGVLQNADDVLTEEQQDRFEKAKTAEQPVIIVTQDEAEKAEKNKAKETKTWVYHAENVRDFAFATSRKFIWDAKGVQFGDRTVMAMSYYPKEGNPLWEKYSTQAVAHTLDVYSKYTFDYPYPIAISVHTDRIGMEYPMICFNGRRPEKDGTYSKTTKRGLISVIIHEVGHNYFPMIVNSDERQWSWMDEGINSFLQYLTEQEWERGYPSRRGPAPNMVDYMKGDKSNITPIMTNSESIPQFGNNAYGKPATALNILRETVLGRELFDFAFKEYSQRWMFKHPSPADFFRTMEDASGTDLDWFWRGWFYTTDHVDISIDEVRWYQLDTKNPEVEKPIAATKNKKDKTFITDVINQEEVPQTLNEKYPEEINDFYNSYDKFAVDAIDRQKYQNFRDSLSKEELAIMETGYNYYEVHFSNHGGLVMPLVLAFSYADGSTEEVKIPAEIWRYNSEKISKIFVSEKELVGIALDPQRETADTDLSNNFWPPRPQMSRFQLFRDKQEKENPMQRQERARTLQSNKGKKSKKRKNNSPKN